MVALYHYMSDYNKKVYFKPLYALCDYVFVDTPLLRPSAAKTIGQQRKFKADAEKT